jgi:uncharacterized membrane protein YccC
MATLRLATLIAALAVSFISSADAGPAPVPVPEGGGTLLMLAIALAFVVVSSQQLRKSRK